MGLSVADIVAKFPVKTLPKITGEPDYATIGHIIQTLYGNTASLPTTIGGGAHGHIGLNDHSIVRHSHTDGVHGPRRPRTSGYSCSQCYPFHP
jgi:hypothetical protein